MRRMKETVYQNDSLGQRVLKFVALMGAIFAIVAAVVVTQRLSNDAIALIIGLLLAGIPLLAIVGLLTFILFRVSQRPQRPAQSTQQMLPSIVLQMPPQNQQRALPYYNNDDSKTERKWNVVGGNGQQSGENYE